MANNKTILITGIAGFIGSAVARHFHQMGWKIVGIDTVAPENIAITSHATYHKMSLPNPDFTALIQMLKPDVCLHAAGRASVPHSMTEPDADFAAGPALCFELLNSFRLYSPATRLIFLSSAAVYGNPTSLPISESHAIAPISPYGYHKRISELLFEEFATVYGLHTTCFRLFSAYGMGLRRQVIWDLCCKALTQEEVILQGTGHEGRDFIHVEDIARAVYFVSEQQSFAGGVVNLAEGKQTKIAELAAIIFAYLGRKELPLYNGVVPSGVPLNWEADVSLMRNAGFQPAIPLAQGLLQVARWCAAELAPNLVVLPVGSQTPEISTSTHGNS